MPGGAPRVGAGPGVGVQAVRDGTVLMVVVVERDGVAAGNVGEAQPLQGVELSPGLGSSSCSGVRSSA